MKNRPLLCVCLVLLFMISVVTAGGGKRFIKELRPSPVELYAKDEENVTVQGTIYRQEQKETYQKIYLKDSRVYLDSNQSRSDIEADTYKKLFQNKKSFKTSNINQVNTQISDIKILICLKSDQKFHIGNKIQLTGEVAFFDNARNPGNFDQRFYYQKQDIHASIWAEHATLIDDRRDGLKDWLADFRMQWKEVLKYELGEQKGAILAAVLLGEKSEMDQDVKELYQANGVGHILAISGLHLSFVGLGVYRLLRRGTGSYWIGGIAGGALLLLYVLMIGMTVSVIRAWVMFLFRIGADITGRHYDMPTALSVAAVIAVYSNPLYILDGGFWLSFGAVFAICITAPLIRELPGKALWSSVALNSILWPVILYCFYEIPVYSVILNLVIVPCMSLLLSLGITGSALCCQSYRFLCGENGGALNELSGMLTENTGKLLMEGCRWILQFYETVCRYTLKLPKARWVVGRPGMIQIVIYYVLLSMCLVILYQYYGTDRKIIRSNNDTEYEKVKTIRNNMTNISRKKLVLAGIIYLCGFLILTSGHRIRKGLEITMLDVGQGDCICIEAPDGSNYLVDGGSSDVKAAGKYRIESFLKSRGIGKLDYVFASHGDMDHISGIEELMERQQVGVKIDNIVLPSREVWDDTLQNLAGKAEKLGVRVWILDCGRKIKSEDLTFRCLGPEAEKAGNEASMILHLSYEGFDMLFTGDVEKEGEEHLTERLAEDDETKNISWEVLKVAHHGSKNSTTEEFLEAAKPEYAWISAGRKNRYGHPHQETLKRLEKYQISVFTTQENGAVRISVREKTMRIHGRSS